MRLTFPFLAVLLSSANAFAFPQSTHPAMLDPAKATAQAPETFKAKFETTKGDVTFECTRAWAPHGVDRFYNLVRIGFFDDVSLFRVSKTFVVQWGIHGDPKVSKVWQDANLEPDPPKQSNTRGMLTYAMAGGSNATRSTQLFINYGDNTGLDAQGFAPVCKVAEGGMDVADKFYSEYGERVTGMQGNIAKQGNSYLKEAWPKLDYIKKATIVGEALDPQRGSKPDDKTATTDEEGAAKSESSPVPWIIGIAIVVGLGAWFLRGKKEEPPPAPKPDGKKKKKKKK